MIRLVKARDVAVGMHVFGAERGLVVDTGQQGEKVRLSFDAGSYVIKEADEEMAVKDE